MIIVLGVAGSGKSTQSQMLAARDGMIWISMGQLLRDTITDERKDLMLAGKVLDEHEVTDILATKLQSLSDEHEVVLDGFPRGVNQAKWLIEQHKQGICDIRAIVHLRADKVVVRQRLMARGRQDDTEQAINERFYEYDHVIRPIINLMQQNHIPVVDINAQQSPEAVFAEVIQYLHEAGVSV